MKIYVDKLGCNIHVKRSFARSIKREKAYRPVATQPGRNVTVCAIEKIGTDLLNKKIMTAINGTIFILSALAFRNKRN